ncbi:MAG: signal peptide peptidase SppA [Thermacetogeniaceae bacterium]
MNRKKAGILLVGCSFIITAIALAAAFVLRPHAVPGKVAVIRLTGPIAFGQETPFFSGATTEQTLRDLERAEKDRSIKAVVLRIDSPGGSAAASQELYSQVVRLKRSGKKVVASLGDTAASGGYYVAAACDRIVADPATVTGSIGVIAQVPNLQELYRKIGISQQTFKSGEHKDMLSPNRPLTPEEAEIMQGIIDDTYEQFLRAVAAGRHLPIERVRALADGRIYTGLQAKRLGLVDAIGGERDAVLLAAKLAGIKGEPEAIEYREVGFLDLLKGLGLWGGFSADGLEGLFAKELFPLHTVIRY